MSTDSMEGFSHLLSIFKTFSLSVESLEETESGSVRQQGLWENVSRNAEDFTIDLTAVCPCMY
jgi:hypothetical protein